MATINPLLAGEASDPELVRLALGEDKRAFGLLMSRHEISVLRYLAGMVGQSADAHDVAQDTFVAVYRNLWRYDPDRPFLAWLFVIARNKARDFHRRRSVLKWVSIEADYDNNVSQDPGPEDEIVDRDTLARTQQAIAQLAEGLKTPLLLSSIEGLPLAEIGKIMGLSTKAVEVRIYRARKKLKQVIPREG